MSRMMSAAAVVAVLLASNANAQTAPAGAGPTYNEQFFLGINAGGLINTSLVTSNATVTIYNQEAAVTERRDVSGGPLFELAAGKPLGGRFAVGATVSMRSATSDSAIAASVPHPLFFGLPRAVSTTSTGMKSTQTWLGLLAFYTLPSSSALRIRVFAGPALAAIKHDTVGSFTVTETSNASQPAISITRGSVSKQFWGAIGGLDLSVRLTGSVGLGAFVRYAGAQANVTGAESGTLGGLEAGAGLRFSFQRK